MKEKEAENIEKVVLTKGLFASLEPGDQIGCPCGNEKCKSSIIILDRVEEGLVISGQSSSIVNAEVSPVKFGDGELVGRNGWRALISPTVIVKKKTCLKEVESYKRALSLIEDSRSLTMDQDRFGEIMESNSDDMNAILTILKSRCNDKIVEIKAIAKVIGLELDDRQAALLTILTTRSHENSSRDMAMLIPSLFDIL